MEALARVLFIKASERIKPRTK
jgi:hypothetical protein